MTQKKIKIENTQAESNNNLVVLNNSLKKLLRIAWSKVTVVMLILILTITKLSAQQEKIAVLNFDVKGIQYDGTTIGDLVRLELEKKNLFYVMDKYDINYVLQESGIEIGNCYGKICIVEAGKILKANKMLTGSVEKLDDKIIIILRLINVSLNIVEKTDIMEYINTPEIQLMVQISINNLLNIPNDNNIVDQLAGLNTAINSPKNQLILNGPRMGFAFIGGLNGEIIKSSSNEGGFDAYPFSTQIGYQKEINYMSSGNFQALIEIIPMVSGLEQSRFIPSLTLLNGFRSNVNGFEIGFGPIFEFSKIKKGYYIGKEWHLVDESSDNEYPIIKRMDSRADIPTLETAWIWAIGKTFKSGYINIPINVYISMRKNGYVVGGSFGFNVSKW